MTASKGLTLCIDDNVEIDLTADSDSDSSSDAGSSEHENEESFTTAEPAHFHPVGISYPQTEVELLVAAILAVDAANPLQSERYHGEIRYAWRPDNAPATLPSELFPAVQWLPQDFEIDDHFLMSYQENALLYYVQNRLLGLAGVVGIVPKLNSKPRVIKAVMANIGYSYSCGAIPDADLEAILVHVYKHGDGKFFMFEALKEALRFYKQCKADALLQQQAHEQVLLQNMQQQAILTPQAPPTSQTNRHQDRPAQRAQPTPQPPATPTPTPAPEKLPPLWNHTKPRSDFLFKFNRRRDIPPVSLPTRPSPQQETTLCIQAQATDAKVHVNPTPPSEPFATQEPMAHLFSGTSGVPATVNLPGANIPRVILPART